MEHDDYQPGLADLVRWLCKGLVWVFLFFVGESLLFNIPFDLGGLLLVTGIVGGLLIFGIWLLTRAVNNIDRAFFGRRR